MVIGNKRPSPGRRLSLPSEGLRCFGPSVRPTLSPKPMDIWASDEARWWSARVYGEEPFNAVRFGFSCLFGSIVAGELLYLLINTARHGKQFAFLNFMIPVLACLIVQFIVLAGAMWLAYVPWRTRYPVCIASYISFCSFSLKWLPDSCRFRSGHWHVLFSLDSFGPGRSNQLPPLHYGHWEC
jgi:hypothetical protein